MLISNIKINENLNMQNGQKLNFAKLILHEITFFKLTM